MLGGRPKISVVWTCDTVNTPGWTIFCKRSETTPSRGQSAYESTRRPPSLIPIFTSPVLGESTLYT